MNPPKNYEEAVSYIMDIPKFAGKHSMEDTTKFLHLLGDPDKKMRLIHVAGTNGKGSVCTFMKSILKKSGYSVSVFTSPHLVDIRERIDLNGEMVSREAFFDAFVNYSLDLAHRQIKFFCQWLETNSIDKPAFQYFAVTLAVNVFVNQIRYSAVGIYHFRTLPEP